MPTISIRGNEMPASPIRKLAPLADAAKQRGVHVFHLNIGQPDLPTPQAAIDAIRNIDRKVLEYSPSAGNRSYREKLVGYYAKFNINLTADDIIITSGGSEAVLFSFLSCLNPGDEIIVPEPAYANYMAFAISAGAKIRTIATTIEEGFSLPKVEKFEELINERTKAILICNPNNPTSSAISTADMKKLLTVCRSLGIFVMIDETYIEFAPEGTSLSAVSLVPEFDNFMVIRGVSKFFAAPGLRFGYGLTSNQAFLQTLLTHQNPWSLNSIGAYAGERMLKDTDYIQKTWSLINSERTRMCTELSGLDTVKIYPAYANFVLVKILKEGLTSFDVFEKAIHQNLMIRDCSSFESLNGEYVRFCIMNPEDNDRLLDVFRSL